MTTEQTSVTVLISFGQVHTHRVNGKTFDCDCVARITGESRIACRKKAFAAFGDKFFTDYPEDDWPELSRYFPRGIIDLEN